MQKSDVNIHPFGAFSPFPVSSYSDSQSDLLVGIETALSAGMKRMQVLTEMPLGNLPLVLTNLERLLQHAGAERILLLLSSPHYQDRVRYECETFLSRRGLPFSRFFKVQHELILSDPGDAQVYVSTIRKVYAQVKRWEWEAASSNCAAGLHDLFDVVVVFDSLSASPMWRTVLDAFDCPTIAYSGSLDPATCDMLSRCVVCTRYAKHDVERVLRDFLEQENTPFALTPYPDRGQVGQTTLDGPPSRRTSRVLFSLPCRAWRSGHGDAEGFARLYSTVERMAMP